MAPRGLLAEFALETYGFVRSCPKKVEKMSCDIALEVPGASLGSLLVGLPGASLGRLWGRLWEPLGRPGGIDPGDCDSKTIDNIILKKLFQKYFKT